MLIRKHESHSNSINKNNKKILKVKKDFHGNENYTSKEREKERIDLTLLGWKQKKSNISISKAKMDYGNQLALLSTVFTMNEVYTSSSQMESFVLKWFINSYLQVNIHGFNFL